MDAKTTPARCTLLARQITVGATRHVAQKSPCSRSQGERRHILRATETEEPSTSSSEEKKEEDFRFKYDFANSRWIRVKKDFKMGGVNQADKYSEEKWKEGNATMITPRTGVPYLVWPVMHAELTRQGLKSVEPEEALKLVEQEGAVILDVRPEYQYKKERIVGARHISLFRIVEGTQFWDRVKKVAMASLFMAATERDPDFGKKAAEQLDKNTTVIVYCGRGGTLVTGSSFGKKTFKDDPEKMFGIESRSLKGCYELQQAGFKKVLHLKGGLSQWRYEGRETQST